MTGLRLEGLRKSFPGTLALDDVSFEVRSGSIHALVGHNGSGKSTLIKLLSGFHGPDDRSSRVAVDGESVSLGEHAVVAQHGLRFVHQNLGLIDQMSIADNLAFEWSYDTGRWGRIRETRQRVRAASVLRAIGYELDPHTLVGDLSASERVAVALARAMHHPSGTMRYLILDEPTAVMPATEVRRLFTSLREIARAGIGILFVSHHIDEILDIADEATVLRSGRVVARVHRRDFERDQLVELIGGAAAGSTVDLPQAPISGKPIALVAEGLGGGTVVDTDFSICQGEVLGIAGLTGSGRECVVPLLYGGISRRGVIRLGRGGEALPGGRPDLALRAGMGMVPADRLAHGICASETVRESMFLGPMQGFRLRHRHEIAESQRWIERLGIRPADHREAVVTASGGNQQKIVIARALRQRPSVLLLDQPTQGVDVGAISQIHSIIKQEAADGMAVVVASTDDEELATLCDRVLVFRRGQVVETLSGAALTPATLLTAVLGGEAA